MNATLLLTYILLDAHTFDESPEAEGLSDRVLRTAGYSKDPRDLSYTAPNHYLPTMAIAPPQTASRLELSRGLGVSHAAAVVVGTIEGAELPQLRSLMLQYWDRPMDFADATLVHLANRESLTTILTVDQADFATYRLAQKRRFQVLPLGRPSS